MTQFIALLRAVNVGGTGKLPMSDLRRLCEEQGFQKVKTYIASGNVVFASDLTEKQVKQKLGSALSAYAGKTMDVFIRTADEMQAVLAANPFKDKEPKMTVAIFLDAPPPSDFADKAKNRASEEILSGMREVYVHYPDGQGQSKLIIPDAKAGTARNMNTVTTLADLASGL